MSIFKDFFVKEKPVFTGITRGIAGFGFGASGGGGFSGGAGGGGSGKTQNVSGDTVDLSSPLTNTADGSTTGSTDLQTWIRAASGVDYVIPNSGNYGMQATLGGNEGHAGWTCVWSYQVL